MQKYWSLIFLIFLSCQSSPKIKDFDTEKWREDKNGCLEYRLDNFQLLISQRVELKGRNATQIHKFLGLPNKNQLYTRDQKYYFYTLTPNQECNDYQANASQQFLRLRFNSIGNVNEVTWVEE